MVQQRGKTRARPAGAVEIDGVRYYAARAVCDAVGVSRQTLWRWRKAGKAPAGTRYRGREILFTAAEVDTIARYARRIEPVTSARGRRSARRATASARATKPRARAR